MVDQSRSIKISTVGYLLLIVLAYAGLDEFHQSFVPSRTPAIIDVLFDFSGGVLGLLMAAISSWRHELNFRRNLHGPKQAIV